MAYKYCRRAEGLRDRRRHPRRLARPGARLAGVRFRRRSVNSDPVALKARNRLAIVESRRRIAGLLPALAQVLLRARNRNQPRLRLLPQDSDNSFAVGVRQADREEPYKPYGVSDEEWDKRAHEARHDINNFALYNAPPGTVAAHAGLLLPERRQTAAPPMTPCWPSRTTTSTKPMPGYKVMVSHFHMHFNEAAHATPARIDVHPTWVDVFRGLGVNIANLADFHSDSHPKDPGPIRFAEQKVYFDGCRRFSDRNFLLIPGEEPDDTLGGHYISMMPRPVFWSQTRQPGQQFIEDDPKYGKVYHISNETDELDMLRRENGLMWQAHPRTKGSTGYPDAVRERPHFLSDRFLGGSFQSLPVDQSEKRICEKRCLGLLDDMNNWTANPKYLIAEGDTYMKYPDDETFPQLIVNYVKLDRVPALRRGLEPHHPRHAGRRFLRLQRRSAAAQLGHRGQRRPPHVHRRSRMDLPAGIRRAGLGRWRYHRHASHFGYRPAGLRLQEIQHSVRCDGQEMGAIRGLGFGRQRRLHPARASQLTKIPRAAPRQRTCFAGGLRSAANFCWCQRG